MKLNKHGIEFSLNNRNKLMACCFFSKAISFNDNDDYKKPKGFVNFFFIMRVVNVEDHNLCYVFKYKQTFYF